MESVLEPRTEVNQEHKTSTKTKIQRTIEFLKVDDQSSKKRDVFEFFEIDHTRDYKIIKQNINRHLQNFYIVDFRKQHHILFKNQINRAKKIIQI